MTRSPPLWLALCLLLGTGCATARQSADAPPAPPATAPNPVAKINHSSCQELFYPRGSLKREETGTVVMSFLITVDGTVGDSKLISSSGFEELDEAVRSHFSSCRFKPATENGKPVPVWHSVTYKWALEY